MTAPYVSYARMDALHELAQPRTESALELNFILLSQVKELLFRTVHADVSEARRAIAADDVTAAARSLDRANRSQQVLLSVWDAVNGIPVEEFLTFRHVLGEASGTQSYMYRCLEFALGARPDDVHTRYASQLAVHPELADELAVPSLYDESLRFAARRGLPVPDDVLWHGAASRDEPDERIEQTWLEVYRAPDRYRTVLLLAEGLMETAYRFSCWRAAHLLVVERILGRKHGTGGTSGVPWLRAVNERRFFPELWSVRTLL